MCRTVVVASATMAHAAVGAITVAIDLSAAFRSTAAFTRPRRFAKPSKEPHRSSTRWIGSSIKASSAAAGENFQRRHFEVPLAEDRKIELLALAQPDHMLVVIGLIVACRGMGEE